MKQNRQAFAYLSPELQNRINTIVDGNLPALTAEADRCFGPYHEDPMRSDQDPDRCLHFIVLSSLAQKSS